MANWLERARREIPRSTDWGTAKTDEENPTAVTSVPKPGESENLQASIGSNGSVPVGASREIEVDSAMKAVEESVIRAWLAHIEETDEAIITHVLKRCREDLDVRIYFYQRAVNEVPMNNQPND